MYSITIWDIRDYQAKRRETVEPKTVNNELLVLTAVLKTARLWQPLKQDYVPLRAPGREPGLALSPEDLARLIATARTHDKWFVALCASVLAYATGCRAVRSGLSRCGICSSPRVSRTCDFERKKPNRVTEESRR